MGNLSSKSSNQLDVSCDKMDEIDDFTPSCDGDPRSPSLNIDRTPLQQTASGTNSKVTKNVDLTKECFNKFEDVIVNPALRAAMNEFDPRSPTLDFERTPLALLIKDSEWVAAHNNLDTSAILDVSVTSIQVKELEPKNLCHDLSNLSMQNESELQTQMNISKQLDNVETGNKNEHDHPSVGLLETNFDYLETDIDTVRRQKYKEYNEKLKHITVEVTTESVEKKTEGEVIVEEVVQQVVTEDIAYRDLSDKDPRSPSDGIDRTPILITEKESIKVESKKIKSNKKINSRVKEVLRNNAKLQRNLLYQDIYKDNDIKTIAKESLLIYEDSVENITPVAASKSTPSVQNNGEGSRTPLACMMNIDKPQVSSLHNTPVDSANKLSHLKSKIPVKIPKISPSQYTENKCDVKLVKSRRLAANMDLENTPPQPRKACWDRDHSVVL